MGVSEKSFLPDLIYANGAVQAGGLIVGHNGKITTVGEIDVRNPIRLNNRALLPGLVNSHSHAFQRVLRGRTEYRSQNSSNSFWTWRELMYSAATRLDADDVYDASRMAFLEMVLSGITAVGEFHYLHHSPEGTPYEDSNLLAKQVVRAARDVGLRIALLRVAYGRSGYETAPNPRQARFIETDAEIYLRNLQQLISDLRVDDETTWTGVAPHSVRAVPLPYLKTVVEFADNHRLPIHMHVAEQPAEISACIREYGRSPVALLDTEGLLSERFTAVHAIHVTDKAVGLLAQASAIVCACPTTERNLGDGVVPVDLYFKAGVGISLGSDSHVQIDLLEDARELEYHLRLQRLERAVLSRPEDTQRSALAARLFDCATVTGAASIGSQSGTLAPGRPADFFTVDLDDPSIAGTSKDELLSNIVFSLSRAAIRDVVVGGHTIVQEGQHKDQQEIVERFQNLQRKLWS